MLATPSLKQDQLDFRNLHNGTPGGSELQHFLTERDDATHQASEKKSPGVEKVSVVEPIPEDDQLSNILSQDSRVFEIDKTIDEIKVKEPEAAKEEEKSDTHSKTQIAHQNSKTSRQISDITE